MQPQHVGREQALKGIANVEREREAGCRFLYGLRGVRASEIETVDEWE